MSPEGLPERLERALGGEALSAAQPFDAENPLHVDLAARQLLDRIVGHDDVDAFGLLVDLCQTKLVEAAEGVAQDVGLGMPADELVVGLFSWLFVQQKPAVAGSHHFLAWATDWMRAQAEAWVRDLAVLRTPTAKRPALEAEPCVDGTSVRPRHESRQDLYAHLLKICFHRLDVEYRRVLRARDVQDLSLKDLALQFGMSPAEARDKIDTARRRLADAIAGIIQGMNP